MSTMSRLLEELSIATNVCPRPAQAVNYLAEGNTDLLIVDWEEDSAELLQRFNQSHRWCKPTVMVVSESGGTASGTYPLLRRPVTSEAGAQSLKQAYFRMLQDHRQHTRYAVAISLTASDQEGRIVPVTVTNIGEGGIGLSTKELLTRGDVLSFSLLLPDTDTPIDIETRVQWTGQYGAVGCAFARIGPADRNVVDNWLKSKCRIKKPLVEL